MVKFTAVVLLALILTGFQNEVPHDQQHCNNHHGTPRDDKCSKCHKANSCEKRDESQGEDMKCRSHCHKGACRCVAPCAT